MIQYVDLDQAEGSLMPHLIEMADSSAVAIDDGFATFDEIESNCDVLFAIWPDPPRHYGVGLITVKGGELYGSARRFAWRRSRSRT
jgi:hypothetical protein